MIAKSRNSVPSEICTNMFLLLICLLLTKISYSLKDREVLELPKFPVDDVLEVYHLRSAPLPLVRTKSGSFRAQSAGIALRSTITSATVVLQFEPVNISSCFLPIIVYGGSKDSNNSKLIWDKRSHITYKDHIDMSYWQQSTYLVDINGVVYEEYVDWLQSYLEQDRLYTPQSICSDRELKFCYYYSQTWDSFLAHSFQRLARSAITLSPIAPPGAADLVLLTETAPEDLIVDVSKNEPTFRDVVFYYESLMDCLKKVKIDEADDDVPSDLAEAFNECTKNNISYVHIDGTHYLRLHVKKPYARIHEYSQEIPTIDIKELSNDDGMEEGADTAISILLLFIMISGTISALVKLKIFDLCCSKITTIQRQRSSPTAPLEGGYAKSSELPIYSTTSSWSTKKYLISTESALSIFSKGEFPTVLGDIRENIRYQPLSVEDSDNTGTSSVMESACQSDGVECLSSESFKNEILAVTVLSNNPDAKIASPPSPPFAATEIVSLNDM